MYFDVPPVGFHDGFDQTQAQTEATLGAALVAPVEAVPNP